MWNLLQARFILVVATVTFAVPSPEGLAKSGNFAINDSGVQGGGTFTIINGTAEINLRLFLGKEIGKETTNNSTATNATTISVNQNTPSSGNIPPSLGADGNIREDGGSVDPNSQPTLGEESNNRLSGNRVDLNGQLTDGKKEKENKPPGEKLESNAQPSAGGRPLASHVRIVAVDEQPPFKEVQFNDEDIKFMDEALEAHNKFRKIHDAPPMILNSEMSLDAKRFAEKLAKENTLKHSSKTTRPDQGENLAMGCSTDDPPITPSAAVKKWYDEVCKYNFANAAFQKPAGHFSQVVWKPSVELGLGIAEGSKWGMKCTFIVARYRGKGNVDTGNNDFAKNVHKGSFDPAYCSLIDNDETNGFKSAPTAASSSLGEIRNYPEYTGYNEGIYENGSHTQFRGKIPRPGKGSHKNAARRGPPKKEHNEKRARVQIL